jgi:glycine/D-amino acid oxidase-like deaminating enzyme
VSRGSVEIAVVGAGIVGCATAYELARRGMRVVLVDRGEVSGGTTGLGEGNVLCCDKRPGAELELARRGLAVFDEIEELLGRRAGIRRKGALVVHRGEAGWAAEAERLEALRAGGVECHQLGIDELRRAEPELTGRLRGGSFFPRDLQCAPRAIARGLAAEAARLGAVIQTGCTVETIAVRGGRVDGLVIAEGRLGADTVVIAAGCWSAPLARSAELELPVEPRKGQLVRLERRPGFLRHKIVDGAYMTAVASQEASVQVATVVETTLDGHVLVGSSRERCGFDLTPDPAVSEALLEQAARLVPGVRALRSDTAWAGLRPWLPDGLPALGASRAAEGLWVATGHEGAGVALGPISGRVLAQAIAGERPEIELGPFDPDRFAAGVGNRH